MTWVPYKILAGHNALLHRAKYRVVIPSARHTIMLLEEFSKKYTELKMFREVCKPSESDIMAAYKCIEKIEFFLDGKKVGEIAIDPRRTQTTVLVFDEARLVYGERYIDCMKMFSSNCAVHIPLILFPLKGET